jgi:murein DD-endopeptidase MepM/ murein hydrolase activator NlpD
MVPPPPGLSNCALVDPPSPRGTILFMPKKLFAALLVPGLLLASQSASATSGTTSRSERVRLVVDFFDTPEASLVARSVAGLLPALPRQAVDPSASLWNQATGGLNLNSPALDVEYDFFDPVSPGVPPADVLSLLPDSRKFLLGVVDGDALTCPLPGSTFSDTWGAPRPNNRVHVGTDMIAPYGTPVLAVADSTVVRVDRTNEHIPGTDTDPGGLSVAYITTWGDLFYLGHFASIPPEIQPGVRIPAGAVIGIVGNSGNAISSVPHLHIQWHPGAGLPQNPYLLVSRACTG